MRNIFLTTPLFFVTCTVTLFLHTRPSMLFIALSHCSVYTSVHPFHSYSLLINVCALSPQAILHVTQKVTPFASHASPPQINPRIFSQWSATTHKHRSSLKKNFLLPFFEKNPNTINFHLILHSEFVGLLENISVFGYLR